MGRPTQSLPSDNLDSRTLADAFQDIYEEMFRSRLPTSAFSVALQSYMRDKAPYLVYGTEDLQEQKPCTPAVYDGLMPMLVQDLIQTCKVQYSELEKGEEPSARKPTYLAIALSRDDDTLPFSPSASPDVEDLRLNAAEVASLSQAWLASHPLANCVSIADVYGEGHLNRALLSLVACEGSSLLGLPHIDQLLDQAHRLFFSTRLPDKDDAKGLLLACQISTLLSWRHTAHTRVKWGIACLALACQLMAQIESREECQGTILSNLKSFLSVFTVWSFAQLDRSSGCLSVACDPMASPLSQFYSSTAVMTSLLLNSHPDVHGIGMAKVQNGDFDILCQQLRINITSLSFDSVVDSNGHILLQAMQHILVLSLLFPRNAWQNLESQQAHEVISRCNVVIPLLLKLANDAANREGTLPLLRKLAFHRQDQVRGDMKAVNCTIASLLFITAAEALHRLNQMDVGCVYWQTISELAHRLAETPLSLVVETEEIKQARENLQGILITDFSTTASPQDSAAWLDSMLPSLSASLSPSINDSQTDLSEPNSDLIDCLWGQLQWDVPFDCVTSTQLDYSKALT